ncbi:hypothetical protein [Sagittula salina]|uniref:Uncharacterized protein n=1 Tax=Sagittula salina TaxID=2820268 RepID=A0A940S164_9RHOB|nr:hypothetical protein [Sagittula salina]MBP0483813.1 hypothetical protein [Sagittula salina]
MLRGRPSRICGSFLGRKPLLSGPELIHTFEQAFRAEMRQLEVEDTVSDLKSQERRRSAGDTEM